ncbi:MAG: carboxylesterase/lipase family protein, partial [Segniliparus sp.]|uniref:carboxylesterase/lipase family protein n=1 Tax=Segniliparus sp. TaxID=2804064 RepID=UPI003F2FA579
RRTDGGPAANDTAQRPRVEVAQGVLRGVREGGLFRFNGVPYAQPPVGDLRFRDPAPALPWAGERDAAGYSPRCPQPRGTLSAPAARTIRPSEDCLHLHVVSRAEQGARRPVLMFFHGGSNLMGESSWAAFGGGPLVRSSDVVLVAPNFRLGAFGFAHFEEFGTPERPFDSNLGTKDALAALRWTRENIAAFGGDPDNITIWGQSSGASTVLALMTAPEAKGLFARAIAQSPPAATVLDQEESQRYARWFCEILGATPGEAPSALAHATSGQLLAASARLGRLVARRRPGARCFAPLVDGALLPRRILDAFSLGHAHRAPLVIGTNRDDVAAQPLLKKLVAEREDLTAVVASMDRARAAGAESVYPESARRRSAISFIGDLRYWLPSLAVAQAHSAFAPTYMYRFDWSSRMTRMLGLGATHGIELMACFPEANRTSRALVLACGGRSALDQTAERLQRRWLQFAAGSSPGSGWPQYRPEDRQTLVLDADERAESDPWRERRAFWSGFDIANLNHAASTREPQTRSKEE